MSSVGKDESEDRAVCSQTGQKISIHSWLQAVQGREHIRPEAYRVVFLLVEGNPGYQDCSFDSARAHSESNVVLPEPAGDETSVRGRL